ncbi:glycoside hydrolase family 3 protein [Methyloceanibacter sp.]|uniref:glycoside hydrolase family 3 protein n=1 Tax=Methyloceanibacter sp. TaxID=1965321 RepID=UPI003D6CE651
MRRIALGALAGLLLIGSIGFGFYRPEATPPAVETAEATVPANQVGSDDVAKTVAPRDVPAARQVKDGPSEGAVELVAAEAAPQAGRASEGEKGSPAEAVSPQSKPGDAGKASSAPPVPGGQVPAAIPAAKPAVPAERGPAAIPAAEPAAPAEQMPAAIPAAEPAVPAAEPAAPMTTQSLDGSRPRAEPEPDENNTDIAATPIPSANLERMIGQMIIVGFVGTKSSDPGVAAVQEEIKNGLVGGVMLLQRNVTSPPQVRALNDSLRRAGGSVVPLISVDQEGGEVQRLTPGNGHRAYPSPAAVAGYSGPDSGGHAMSIYRDMAAELRADGFNVNFGPDVDLNINPSNPIIGAKGRSYGVDPKQVRKFASIFNSAHRQADILTAAKHFPGHGSSSTDSHIAFTDITKTWKPIELEPFKQMLGEGGVNMLMIGHLYLPEFSDGPGIPTSLSKKTMDYVRNEMGFTGVIVSDDMEMGALRQNFSFEDRIVRAVAAGTDMLIFANRLPAPQLELGAKINAVILNAVNSRKISREQIEQSYARIMRMKRKLVEMHSAAN